MIPDADVAYAKKWGMNTEIQDLRRVVKEAQQKGRRVVVGGHSLGGSITTAYATWDFKGKAGADGLSGLVFIDGAAAPRRCPWPTPTPPSPTSPRAPRGSPSAASPRPSPGCSTPAGRSAPSGRRTHRRLGQAFALLPANLKPPIPVTNLGQYGYALDEETSPPGLVAAQAHLGHLAASGTRAAGTRRARSPRSGATPAPSPGGA